VIYRYRFLIIILAAVISVPLTSFSSTLDPNTECPKKKSQEGDSVSISEPEVKDLDEMQLQEIPMEEEVAIKAPKNSGNSFDTSIDESNKGMDRDPNSAMSFNFIFYIIDKFKFTDPME
jgi:hypothetical protein